jgi:hypothetical protein
MLEIIGNRDWPFHCPYLNPVTGRYVDVKENRECPLPGPSLTLLYTSRYVGDYRDSAT